MVVTKKEEPMFFPIYIDLTGKQILVVGGGMIASRRVRALAGFAGKITVVAPKIRPELAALADSDSVRLLQRPYSEQDLDGMDFVLAATDDPALNARIGAACRKKGIAVNVCSDQMLCDFQFPSIVQQGDLVVGINASGRDHGLVKRTRKKIEQALGVQESRYQTEEKACFRKEI